MYTVIHVYVKCLIVLYMYMYRYLLSPISKPLMGQPDDKTQRNFMNAGLDTNTYTLSIGK